jgi:hypothetical protein
VRSELPHRGLFNQHSRLLEMQSKLMVFHHHFEPLAGHMHRNRCTLMVGQQQRDRRSYSPTGCCTKLLISQ